MLRQKLDDWGNCSRRNNLRIAGFAEVFEGRNAAEFLAKVLPEILRVEFTDGLEIEPNGKPPHPFIVFFLRHTDKEKIGNAARDNGKVTWMNHHIMLFPDYSKAVEENCQCFNQCKKMLHE